DRSIPVQIATLCNGRIVAPLACCGAAPPNTAPPGHRAPQSEWVDRREDRSGAYCCSQCRLRTEEKIADRRHHGAADDHRHIVSFRLAGRHAAHLAYGL